MKLIQKRISNKIYTVLVLLSLLPVIAFCQSDTKEVILFNQQLKLQLPQNFVLQERITNNSIVDNIEYSDEKKTFSFIITMSDVDGTDNDIPSITDRAITSVKETYSSKSILDDGISLNDGYNVGYLKYQVEKGKDKGFHYVFYASPKDKIISFYFTTSINDKELWDKKIDAVVASIRLNFLK